jgi:ATP-dependent RNA helicase RhlE
VQDIAHVINYDLPGMAEDFIHRVGRTGRAGERGVASTLFDWTEAADLRQLERTLGIQMERQSPQHDAYTKPEKYKGVPQTGPRTGSLTALPGEVLQNAR